MEHIKSILWIHHVIFDRVNLFHKQVGFINYFPKYLLSSDSIHKFIHVVFLSKFIVLIIYFVQVVVQLWADFEYRILIELIIILEIRNHDKEVHNIIVLKNFDITVIRLTLFIFIKHFLSRFASLKFLHSFTISGNNHHLQIILTLLHILQNFKSLLNLLATSTNKFMIIDMNHNHIR